MSYNAKPQSNFTKHVTGSTNRIISLTDPHGYLQTNANLSSSIGVTTAIAELFSLEESVVIDQISFNVTVAILSSTIDVAIYNVDVNGVPTTILANIGTISSATTGLKTVSGLNISLDSGTTYALAYSVSSSATGISIYVNNLAGLNNNIRIVHNGTTGVPIVRYTFAKSSPLPANFTGGTAQSSAAGILFFTARINSY